MRKNGELTFVRVKDGNVFVRETSNSKAFKINQINMLEGEGQDTIRVTTNEENETGSGEKHTKLGNSTKSVAEEASKNKRTIDQRSPQSEVQNSTRKKIDHTNKFCFRKENQPTLDNFKFNANRNFGK